MQIRRRNSFRVMVLNYLTSLAKVSWHATWGSEVLSPRRHTKHCRLSILILKWFNPSLINYNGSANVNGIGNTSHHTHCPYGHIRGAWQRKQPTSSPSSPWGQPHRHSQCEAGHEQRHRKKVAGSICCTEKKEKCYTHMELPSTSPINLVKLFPSWNTFKHFPKWVSMVTKPWLWLIHTEVF